MLAAPAGGATTAGSLQPSQRAVAGGAVGDGVDGAEGAVGLGSGARARSTSPRSPGSRSVRRRSGRTGWVKTRRPLSLRTSARGSLVVGGDIDQRGGRCDPAAWQRWPSERGSVPTAEDDFGLESAPPDIPALAHGALIHPCRGDDGEGGEVRPVVPNRWASSPRESDPAAGHAQSLSATVAGWPRSRSRPGLCAHQPTGRGDRSGTVTEDGDMINDDGKEVGPCAHGSHDPPSERTATSTATMISGPIQEKSELDLPDHQPSSRPELEQELDLKLDLSSWARHPARSTARTACSAVPWSPGFHRMSSAVVTRDASTRTPWGQATMPRARRGAGTVRATGRPPSRRPCPVRLLRLSFTTGSVGERPCSPARPELPGCRGPRRSRAGALTGLSVATDTGRRPLRKIVALSDRVWVLIGSGSISGARSGSSRFGWPMRARVTPPVSRTTPQPDEICSPLRGRRRAAVPNTRGRCSASGSTTTSTLISPGPTETVVLGAWLSQGP